MKSLTLKQKRFVQKYLEYKGNATQAARAVYNGNYQTSKVIGFQNLQKVHIKAYLEYLLEEAGLTDKQLAKHLKTIVDEGINSGTAEATDALKALDMVLRLKDRYPSHKVEAVTRNTNFDVSGLTQDELLQQLTKTTEENKKLLEELSGNSKKL